MSFSIKRLAGIAVVATGLSVATFAFTATNTVEASKAGSGSGGITGYAVSAVDYVLNSTDPSTIDSVSFTLDTAPKAGSTVKIQLVPTTGAWYDCTVVDADATCTTTGATVLTATDLTVVAAD